MKLTIQLSIFSAFNIFILFVFQWYVLIHIGPGVETDAFFASMTVPQIILIIISGSLMHILVPLLTGENDKIFNNNSWAFLLLIGGLFFLLAIILSFLAPWWVPLVVPGFNEVGKDLTINFTQIQLIGMFFTAINGVQFAVYHARQKFLWAEFVPFFSGILAFILLVWALPRFGIIAAVWISIFRMFLQSLLLLPGMGRPCFPDLRNDVTREAWLRIKPLLLGNAYYKTDILVDRYLLSLSTSGSLSLYNFAHQIYSGVNQVTNKSIAAPLVPTLSIYHKKGDLKNYRHHYQRKMLLVVILCLTGLLMLGLFGPNIISLLVGYGNFEVQSVNKLWWIMIWLGGMLIGGSAGQIASSTFYSMGDTVTPTRMSIITYTIYIPLKIAVFYFLGIFGLAIVTSIYYMTNLLLQIFLLNRRLPV